MKAIRLLLFPIIIAGSSCHSQSPENSIVLINTGPYNKGKIAKEIAIVNTLNPKVVSLDIAFPEYVGDSDDKSLYLALQNCKKLVMPSKIHYEGKDYHDKEMISVALTCAMEFFPRHAKAGFVSAKIDKDDIQIPRQFIVWQKGYTEDIYQHFSIVTAMAFDSLKTMNFIQSHDRLVDVDYDNEKRKFRTFSASDVLKGKLSKKDIEGKIVMLGFLGPGDEDKFFIPQNLNRNESDMYGLEYLATIVAQVLESK